ncbi:MAG: plasmid pRiA4b ORF-3 family protein [Synergistaceae bacterium]|jgi:hypothetical protein|nr:plasmid pRiA4b ORF-3 family protein [Synergistaceae bacterium]
MLIHVTKKLADKLKIKLSKAQDDFDELYSWRANVVDGGRHMIVVFMNDVSQYVIVLNNIMEKDWPKLPELFIDTLRETLLAEQINPEVIERYISEAGKISYFRNTDRQKTLLINHTCACFGFSVRSDNVGLSIYASHCLIGNINNYEAMYYPIEKIIELFERYGLPVRKCRAFDLDIRLALMSGDACRKLRVPANITFEQLHSILQAAFCWKDYHLYNFALFAEGRAGEEPSVELAISDKELKYRDNARLLTGVKLSEYIPRYKYILYVYDYGDDWHHYIEVTDVLEDCTDELPVLLSGEGDAPPEDVGGTPGYEDFLAVINDPGHEDHKSMTDWAKGQRWKKFDAESTARRLKFVLSP